MAVSDLTTELLRAVAAGEHVTELQRAVAAGKLLTPKQVSELIGVAEQTLAHWRTRNRILPYLPISNRCVRYRASDVQAYIDANMQQPANEDEAA